MLIKSFSKSLSSLALVYGVALLLGCVSFVVCVCISVCFYLIDCLFPSFLCHPLFFSHLFMFLCLFVYCFCPSPFLFFPSVFLFPLLLSLFFSSALFKFVQRRALFDSVSLVIQGSMEGELSLMDNLSGSICHYYALPPKPSKHSTDKKVNNLPETPPMSRFLHSIRPVLLSATCRAARVRMRKVRASIQELQM